MSSNTSIEWTDHTFSPWWGCSKVSPGCANCYAEKIAHRFKVEWGPNAERREASETYWTQPRRWNAAAKRAGRRARVFCASMADVFDTAAPEHAVTRLFDLIKATPWLDWQLLTKRPENIRTALPADWAAGYRNVWLGTTVENQAMAEARIPHLLAVPASVRFLSCEPLLGPVDLSRVEWPHMAYFRQAGVRGALPDPQESDDYVWAAKHLGIGWVIVGGESGRRARPMEREWARSLRDQCQAAKVPFFFKQWGEYVHGIIEPQLRLGKKYTGRILDGREWNEFPAVVP